MDTNQSDNHILPTPTSSGASTAPQQQQAKTPTVAQPVDPAMMNPVDVPIRADDIDLIEKEWVNKAKEIVSSTVGDPRRQSKELNKMKTQYISKRFNKEMPEDE